MLLTNFRYFIPLTPRFDDLDAVGHVNEARYITYLEQARIGYAREVLGIGLHPHDVGMIVVKTTIDYLMPLHLKDTVNIYVRCSRVGRKSFDLAYVVALAENERLVSVATMTMVAYNYEQGHSVLMSEEWQNCIYEYELLKPDRQ
ncbi:MAG: acyl-CoA thioesterase [Anaerolineae bacterium]|nr:acyl-CoA thioesterase [Anaerolineae bacterium]